MSRVSDAVLSRENLLQDFFGGWIPSDVELLQKYAHALEGVPASGELIDWLGVRTDLQMHTWLPKPADNTLQVLGLPVPDDMVHAETIEYVALAMAMERAIAHGDGAFTVMELGASYAPWCVASCVVARRLNFSRIHMTAVEASSGSIPFITAHAQKNGLTGCADVTIRPIYAAVHTADQPVYFPKIAVEKDNGAQMAISPGGIDYRGVGVEYDRVDGITLGTLCQPISRVDFLHLDLQGAEERLLTDHEFLSTLDQKIATMFLATQSRLIEGLALKAMSSYGWKLVRERPTTYTQNTRTVDINGWTTRDGGQLWLNPRYGSKHTTIS